MPRRKANPHELGYRFYRGYIYRRGERDYFKLWNPWGQFICILSLRAIPRYVDLSIRGGWEKAPVRTGTKQLELI